MLRTLDLFSGIGGFSLGLERTGGFKTVAFCEIEDYPRKVLAKHWPNTPCYMDIKDLTDGRLKADGIEGIDVICGGFPCQDISLAGKGGGITGGRSGLWSEYARLIREVGPRWVIIENVSALRSRGLVTVLQNLRAIGYDAQWHCITAAYVGAPHRRDRVWIVANNDREFRRTSGPGETQTAPAATATPTGQQPDVMADAESNRSGGLSERATTEHTGFGGGKHVADADHTRCQKQRITKPIQEKQSAAECGCWWQVEPDVGRVADGIPHRVDRLKGLGNAVVPQIVEMIGNAILLAQAGA